MTHKCVWFVSVGYGIADFSYSKKRFLKGVYRFYFKRSYESCLQNIPMSLVNVFFSIFITNLK